MTPPVWPNVLSYTKSESWAAFLMSRRLFRHSYLPIYSQLWHLCHVDLRILGSLNVLAILVYSRALNFYRLDLGSENSQIYILLIYILIKCYHKDTLHFCTVLQTDYFALLSIDQLWTNILAKD